jgi:shikimate dehydrogenase
MKDVYTFADLADPAAWELEIADLPAPPMLAVIGDPIAHSKSPQMHNAALAAEGIKGCYIRLHLAAHEVAPGLARLAELGFVGANVTIPHKAAALALATEAGFLARMMGAVNTLRFDDEGVIRAWNTDGPGFLRAVEESFGAPVSELRVAIIGAGGGAGRAVAVQCGAIGCPRIVLVNRTPEKVEALQAQMAALPSGTEDIRVCAWQPDAMAEELAEIDLVVNATSLGMSADDAPVVPANLLRADHLVYDMVYSGGQSRLLADTKAAGGRGADGLAMLLHQGAIAFEHWFRIAAPVDVMRVGLVGS